VYEVSSTLPNRPRRPLPSLIRVQGDSSRSTARIPGDNLNQDNRRLDELSSSLDTPKALHLSSAVHHVGINPVNIRRLIEPSTSNIGRNRASLNRKIEDLNHFSSTLHLPSSPYSRKSQNREIRVKDAADKQHSQCQ
jgi:hypothetical protein